MELAESAYEIDRASDAVNMIKTIQSMIDVSAHRLEGLRTQCSTSAELTQQEIRTLEGKLLKHFSRQLVIKARFEGELPQLNHIPSLSQWLSVVGLSSEGIKQICNRVSTLDSLRDRSDHELKAWLATVREEEWRRLCRAMNRLRAYTDALSRGEAAAEMQLYWDSWERERHGRGSPRARMRPRGSVPSDPDHATPRRMVPAGKSPTTPLGGRKQGAHLPAPAITKSRSHESQLSARPDASDLSDNSQSSLAMGEPGAAGSPPPSPREPAPAPSAAPAPAPAPSPAAARVPVLSASEPATQMHTPVRDIHTITGSCALGAAPRSPRTPVTRHMAHDIAHRFTKTFNMITTCDFCEKQILFGTGLKCKECKFKCHRDCEVKVPPSCGLPTEFINAYKDKIKDGPFVTGYIGVGSPGAARGSFLATLHRPRRRDTQQQKHTGGPDSSSNTSSCNSSTPSSPALVAPPTPQHPHPHPHPHPHSHPHPPQITPAKPQFHFPEVKAPVSSPNHVSAAQSPSRVVEPEELASRVNSDGSRVSLSGSGSTDSGGVLRADSLDVSKHNDSRWPRQNSLSMKEWDIPYDELKLMDVIGKGRFGTVYRGSWHGAVAVKVLHVQALSDHTKPLDTFKHEVATFRKTRHENLVLFMGACMKPPRLAIVTSLCQGMTLHTLIHLRKDKFNPNKSVIIAQQITQGMGYLHARGIVHKDLKTKNIFLENGKVVITDFGLFSVTKLCFGNNPRGDSLGIPPGWLCYLAPELVRALRPHTSLHLPFSKATDVYAFGTVWYELLSSEFPFKGQPAEAVIWQVGKGVKQALGNMHVSKDIKDILMLCWAYRSSERPDFATLLATLEKLPRKRLARSPSHPVHLSRSADSVF